MADIVKFFPADAAKTPDAVIEQAVGKYSKVFIIGYNKDDELDVRASLNFTNEEIFFAMKLFEHKLFNGDYGCVE